MTKRDYAKESSDLAARQYAYDFDYLMHGYMLRSFAPFMRVGSALEMGCYMGDFTALLAERFDDLTVIEAAENLVQKSRTRVPKTKGGNPVAFHHSTFEAVTLNRKFDNIFLMHTLEHLDDPVGVLKLVNDWLTDAGYLFLVVPNPNAPSRQIAVKMGLISHNAAVTPAEREHGHRCTYSLDTLERDAKAAGLAVHYRSGIFFKPFANFQFDRLMKTDIISPEYMEGCYQMGMQYPDLCASIFLLCGRSASPNQSTARDAHPRGRTTGL
jgi:2-polyprenyl-3-methyl-5-hydroxy-6-metoxy-1,4-benzoquinol methylase